MTVFLLLLTGVLIGAAWYFLKDVDRTRPEITFTGDPAPYREGEDVSILLSNVTAYDSHDGDLTSEVRVNQITPIDNKTRARVTYAVIDARKNIATASQIVDYTPLPDELGDESVTDSPEDVSLADENAALGEGTPDEEALESVNVEGVNAEAPVLVLNSGSDMISASDSFNYSAYIASVTDDKDSQDELFRHITIEGDYSTNRAGTYPLTIYVTDSDGNSSNKETFILYRG
jgi:hypothetical protein